MEHENKHEHDDVPEEELISATVFYEQKKKGRSDETAEMVALAVGTERYYSLPQRFKRWCLGIVKTAIGKLSLAITGIITAAITMSSEKILEAIKHFLN